MSDNEFLHRQLIRLGDMIGDGMHLEPDGKWIEKEYKQTMKALGIYPKRRSPNAKLINERMVERVRDVKCQCGGQLKQTRSRSKRASCQDCGNKYQLLK